VAKPQESRRNVRDYQVELSAKLSVSCFLKSPINARSFFNINALPDAGARSCASKLIENLRQINDLTMNPAGIFLGYFGRAPLSVAPGSQGPPPFRLLAPLGRSRPRAAR
jgi:hypothetical protein